MLKMKWLLFDWSGTVALAATAELYMTEMGRYTAENQPHVHKMNETSMKE